MSNSLSAQLLKAGLINKKQANKAKQEQYAKTKQKQGKKKTETPSESQQLARQAQAAEKERVRLLNRQRQEEDKQKEITAQINQMIEDAKIVINNGDLTYNFADGSKIKKIYITKEVRNQLGKGQLAIVQHKGQYQIVPTEVAQKIAERDKAAVIVLNKPSQKAAEDDPYAAFPIPEDLEW